MTRFLKFAGIGVAGFLWDAGIFHILTAFAAMSPYVAKVLSYFAAATVTWWLNRRFTFAPSGLNAASEWARFLGVNLIGALVNYGAFVIILTQVTVASRYPLLAVAAGALAGLVFNFFLSNKFVFSPRLAEDLPRPQ